MHTHSDRQDKRRRQLLSARRDSCAPLVSTTTTRSHTTTTRSRISTLPPSHNKSSALYSKITKDVIESDCQGTAVRYQSRKLRDFVLRQINGQCL